MSPRRKSGLSKDDIEALKELPRVLKALENLQEQHAKVLASIGMDSLKAAGYHRVVRDAELPERREYEGVGLPDVPRCGAQSPWSSACRMAPGHSIEHCDRDGRTWRSVAALDTPERREYEEAKRAGRKVPVADPFANASPAQRERMAEQRAIIDAERAARGLPTRAVAVPLNQRPDLPDLEPIPEEVVRTETLDTLSDGTTPLADDADDESEVH